MSLFITFEGIEGCGKTTQINLLAAFLKKKECPFLLTREPGGTKIGEKIRQILLSSDHAGMEPMTELFLYVADRIQHYRQVIAPALRDGKTVICDRFADATTVYQGFGRGLDLAWIEGVHARALENIKPDLTFLLDLPVEVGLKRAWKRLEKDKTEEDRFEKEALDFHRRIRDGYLTLARNEPGRIIVLDGMKEEGALHREIVSHLPCSLQG
ncbi:MAG: dTMP kinase [Syntrophaceae bacterium]|nr:dTMP kinase [Syntrophaceae bacterium]